MYKAVTYPVIKILMHGVGVPKMVTVLSKTNARDHKISKMFFPQYAGRVFCGNPGKRWVVKSLIDLCVQRLQNHINTSEVTMGMKLGVKQ